ncbi:HAD family hydrolase [Spelaeicoccus albus]|uniref:Uncharacterized protein n=1 Tax=Spelaeicoccus albus TaxID=1280376 RepID=A0A7Z0D220_9MICO|nr:HAD family hydrolase [Spelaeicoccus albus]NYI67420.1 hypothetical protein [Spelaeicoccus albus]
MPGPVRLVASDIDGTILTSSGLIRPRVIEALHSARDAGMALVFVTGRPTRWLGPIEEQIGHAGMVICSNGSVLYDMEARRIVSAQTIPAAAARAVAERLRSEFTELGFGLETLDGYRVDPVYSRNFPPGVKCRVGQIDELLADSPRIVKMLARWTGDGDEFLTRARQMLTDLVTPTHSSPREALLEMSPLGVDKAHALAGYAKTLGLSADETIAFGDMPNDIEMLRWAGRGYAMAGGHPEAISAAPGLAPPIDEDGVAQVLEGLLAENVG